MRLDSGSLGTLLLYMYHENAVNGYFLLLFVQYLHDDMFERVFIVRSSYARRTINF